MHRIGDFAAGNHRGLCVQMATTMNNGVDGRRGGFLHGREHSSISQPARAGLAVTQLITLVSRHTACRLGTASTHIAHNLMMTVALRLCREQAESNGNLHVDHAQD